MPTRTHTVHSRTPIVIRIPIVILIPRCHSEQSEESSPSSCTPLHSTVTPHPRCHSEQSEESSLSS
ncbi:MAG: hypothetical protein RSD61_03640, partial [Ruthenibacterium sp.]